MKIAIVGIQSNAILMASALAGMSENIVIAGEKLGDLSINPKEYVFKNLEFNDFPCEANHTTKGKHPQPFYRKGRW